MRNLWNLIFFEILFPKFCIFCRKEDFYFCNNCEAKITRKKNSFESKKIFSKYDYRDDRIRKLLFKIKYHNNKYLAQEIGEFFSNFIQEKLYSADLNEFILVPIPISKKRFRNRGYNQTFEISLGINNKLKDLRIVELLIKNKDTKKLFKTNSIEERQNEIKDAIDINTTFLHYYKNKKIIILDDITTTGSTFYEAKKVLIKNGFLEENIYCFALAN